MRLILMALVAVFSWACSEKSPKLLPKKEFVKEQATVVGAQTTFDPKVDILFVVDDSGSMSSHQSNLAANINLFIQEIQKNQVLDYHIGVLTTSTSTWGWGTTCCGKLVGSQHKFVDRATPNLMQVLSTNLLVGTNGDATEKVFEPVRLALTAPLVTGENAGFYRPSAHLAVIFITDAEDQGTESPQDFFNFLLGLKGTKSKISSYGAIVPSTDQLNCPRDGWESPKRIEQFFQLSATTAGKSNFFNLCDAKFGQELAQLGSDLEEKVGRVLLLEQLPDPRTIAVTYGPEADPLHVKIPNDLHKGWVYDSRRNAIIFGDKIDWANFPPGLKIEINFTIANLE